MSGTTGTSGGPSLRGGVAWSMTSFVGTKLLTFVSMLVLARLLAPADFGVLAAVLAFVTLLELMSDLGMKATVIYESERGYSDRVHTAFTLNLLTTAVLTVGAVAAAPLVARLFHAESQTGLFALAAADVALMGLGNIHDALLLRDMRFRRRIVAQLTASAVRAAVTIGLAVAGAGATALVIGFLAGTAASTIVLWLVEPYRPRLLIRRDAVRDVATYGGWASALAFLAAVAQRTDVVVVGSLLGPRALGLYTVAQRVPELVIGSVTWNLSAVAFPALSQRRTRGDGDLTATTLLLVRYSALFGLATGAGLAVIASEAVVVLFSSRWAEAGAVMLPLSLMYGLVCLVFPLGDTFKALGRQSVMAAVNAVALPVSIGAMVLAAPAGVVGVAWARVVTTVVLGVVWIVLISRALGLGAGAVVGALRPGCAAAAGVACGASAALHSVPAGPAIGLGAAVVAGALGGALLLRMLAHEQYQELHALVVGRLHPLRSAPTTS